MPSCFIYAQSQHSATITITNSQLPNVTVDALKVQRNGVAVATLPPTATKYQDTSIQGGLLYIYTVTASNADGDSEPSNSFGIQLPADPPKFQRNDTFQVVTGGGNLNIRSSPGGPIVGTIRNGSTGVIVDGPQTASGVVYWKFNKGWLAEPFIRQ